MLTIHSSGYLTPRDLIPRHPPDRADRIVEDYGLSQAPRLRLKLYLKIIGKSIKKNHLDKRQGGRSSNTVSVQDDLFDS